MVACLMICESESGYDTHSTFHSPPLPSPPLPSPPLPSPPPPLPSPPLPSPPLPSPPLPSPPLPSPPLPSPISPLPSLPLPSPSPPLQNLLFQAEATKSESVHQYSSDLRSLMADIHRQAIELKVHVEAPSLLEGRRASEPTEPLKVCKRQLQHDWEVLHNIMCNEFQL